MKPEFNQYELTIYNHVVTTMLTFTCGYVFKELLAITIPNDDNRKEFIDKFVNSTLKKLANTLLDISNDFLADPNNTAFYDERKEILMSINDKVYSSVTELFGYYFADIKPVRK